MRLLYRRLVETDPLVLLPLLTLLVLIVNAFDRWYSQVPIVLLCAAGMINQRWLRSSRFWTVGVILFASGILLNWASCDNHKYLVCYWCLALCVVFEQPRHLRSEALAWNGRILLALCMGLAVFWRSISDCYLDGSFFHYALLVDGRFGDFAQWTTGLSVGTLAENRELRQIMVIGYEHGVDVNHVVLTATSGSWFWGQVLTWWTILVEATICVLFIWPDGKRVAVLRNTLLLVFATTTYAIATVRGFGWMLMLFGFAQCTERDKHFRAAYLAVFLLIQCYLLPIKPLISWLAQ